MSKTYKIRVNQCYASPEQTARAGGIVAVPEAQARELVERGYGEAVDGDLDAVPKITPGQQARQTIEAAGSEDADEPDAEEKPAAKTKAKGPQAK